MNELLIMRKLIDLDASEVLYDRPFSEECLREDWEARNAEWSCEGNVFLGRNPKPAPGVLMSRGEFPGNILMSFHARTVPPSTHDIDVMWNLSWNEETNERGAAYVAGVQGWWDGKVGLEKSPDYALTAACPCPWFEPGKEYFIQAGSIEGHCFLFVDGELRIEMLDPDPIDSSIHNRVGFEAYQSMIEVRDLVVRRIAWEPREQAYLAE